MVADLGQPPDPVELGGGVDRADVGVLVQRVADPQQRHPPLQGGQHLASDRFLDQQPGAGAADVALVEEDAVDDALDRLVHGRVVEDDVGRLAAQFQGHPLARAGDRPRDLLADLGGTGERDLVHARVLDQRPTGLAGPGDDVDHTGRQVGLLADLRERQRGQRGGLRRLEHDRVAAGQRRCDLPGQHQQREVPRDDLGGHAERPGVRPEAGMSQFVGPAGVVEEMRRHQGHVDIARLADRLAVVDRLQHRQLTRPLLHDPGDPVQVLGPLPTRHGRPDVVERLPSRRDGRVDVFGRRLHDLGQHLFRRGVDGLEPAA
jgi:hypothetical protein